MKDYHYPFDLLEKIRQWVSENISTQFDNAMAEFRKISKIIDDLNNMSVEVPKELQRNREKLEAKISEDEMSLNDLLDKLYALANEIKYRAAKSGCITKSPPLILSVILPNGQTICEKKAVDTFIITLQYMGLEKCAAIKDVIQLGHPVVSKVRNQYINRHPGFIKEVEGYFIETKTSTDRKAEQLREYARKLGINIQVHIDSPND